MKLLAVKTKRNNENKQKEFKMKISKVNKNFFLLN